MPSRTAYEKCPHAIFVRPHMALYEEVSARAFEVFGHYTPYVEGVSVDEAFLDITGSIHLHGSAEKLGEALRREVHAACGVTCSVGIAPNRLLAKIGSEQNKPDGLTLMPFEPDAIAAFLARKPISILWGIGKKTESLLRPYGIVTCGDLQREGVARLAPILGGEDAARHLVNHAFGISDDRVRWEPAEEKSVSREHTFGEDCANREEIRAKLLELVAEVGRRFRAEQRWARTARLKLRDADFNTITRQAPFPKPARDDMSFRELALRLFDQAFKRPTVRITAVRLIGFGVANLPDHPGDGLSLFADPEDDKLRKRERLSATLDALRERGLSTSPRLRAGGTR